MQTFIGIDLGTSGVKLLLVDGCGKILAQQTRAYEVSYPQDGWSEQRPEDWWEAVKSGLADLLDGQDRNAVSGISFGGQMHGLVVLDQDDRVIRPCILWNDGRTEAETAYLNDEIGKTNLSAYTGNIAFAGFTAPKLLWLRTHEPENFAKISKIMLPKDYIAYKLSGAFCTDLSDASGMLLLDVAQRKWSQQMLDLCHISHRQLPQLCESYEIVGTLHAELANLFGLRADVKIAAGAGDNAAAAVGTGTVGENACNVSLGTSGTIVLSSESFAVDEKNALHSFCHADGTWHLMGCILSAASCRKWWLEDVLESTDYDQDEANSTAARDTGLLFLPYLSGERSPHNDVNAKGAFIGLTATSTRGEMSRAVMEGVAFALRDCLEVAKSNGVCPTETNLCGGGAKSKLWQQIVADVLGLPVRILETEQGPAYGGAILAMVGCGLYPSVQRAAQEIVKIKQSVLPQPSRVACYDHKYASYRKAYPALKLLFTEI